MRVRYDAHLPTLSLRNEENARPILEGTVLPTLHSAILGKNWHLCEVCAERTTGVKARIPLTFQR